MIKTLISISLLISVIVIFLGYPQIFEIMIQAKGSFLMVLAPFFSPLAIFCIFFEILYQVTINIIKRF